MSDVVLGGWTNFNFELTPEAKAAFAAATEGFVGQRFTPLAFATQVVAGLNYSFLCKAQLVVPNAPTRATKVHVYQPLPGQGAPHITQIIDIAP